MVKPKSTKKLNKERRKRMENKGFALIMISFSVYFLAALVYAAAGLANGLFTVALTATALSAGFGGILVGSRRGVWNTYDPPCTIGGSIFTLLLASVVGLAFPLTTMFLKSRESHGSNDVIFLETFSGNIYGLCDQVMIAAVLVAAIGALIEYSEYREEY
jgi:Na+/citrate or Na+/malate symporter